MKYDVIDWEYVWKAHRFSVVNMNHCIKGMMDRSGDCDWRYRILGALYYQKELLKYFNSLHIVSNSKARTIMKRTKANINLITALLSIVDTAYVTSFTKYWDSYGHR